MPAVRTKSTSSTTEAKKPASKRSVRKPVVDGDGDSKNKDKESERDLEAKIGALRTAKAWTDIITLIDDNLTLPLSSTSLQGAYCRAFFHSTGPSATTISNAKAISADVLKGKADSLDGLLCAGKLAQLEGDTKGVSDKALEAYKASGYKDEDALNLLKSGQTQGGAHANAEEASKDHYETLHVARTAPDGVISAAHAALSHPEGSAEAIAADEALAVLSDPKQRAQYDETLSRRKTGGGGREFSGGSEILKQLGEALGLVFPEGFVFPPSGRFQGGFGGGFEYTWGAAEGTAVTAPATATTEDTKKVEEQAMDVTE